MNESTCVLTADHALRAQAVSMYVGSRGAWTEYWDPEEKEVIFPFFLGSQGLYSTLTDYARFLDFWMRKGRAGKERLVGPRFLRKGWRPSDQP